jgi:hypothetical protein
MSITLQQYIEQNPAATLNDAQNHPEITQRMISNKTFALYLDVVGLYLIVHEIAQGKHDTEILDEGGNGTGDFANHAAKEACLLIVNTLADSSSDNDDFNFMQGTAMGDGVIARTEQLRDVTLNEHATEIQNLLDVCIAHCNTETKPFADITQSQFNNAKGLFKPYNFTHVKGKEIVVDLITETNERVAATVWRVRNGYADKNMGRNVFMQEAHKYEIDSVGVPSGEYQVRVPLLDADFTVESV